MLLLQVKKNKKGEESMLTNLKKYAVVLPIQV